MRPLTSKEGAQALGTSEPAVAAQGPDIQESKHPLDISLYLLLKILELSYKVVCLSLAGREANQSWFIL
jgi:hypothetical protein